MRGRKSQSGVLETCDHSFPRLREVVPGAAEMQANSFDDRELEILILALRYWKAHRGSVARRTDPVFRTSDVDALVAKLLNGRTLSGFGMPEFQEENGY